MARDPSATRDRLIEAGERLFAQKGIDAVTVSEIHAAAGQRNASALHYHFGSRRGLLLAIVHWHQRDIDDRRAAMLAAIPPDPLDTRALAATLVRPQLDKLRSRRGRAYLRILPQAIQLGLDIRSSDQEQLGADALVELIGRLRSGLHDRLPADLVTARLTTVVSFVAVAMADRARALDRKKRPDLDDEQFADDLVETVAAVLAAPAPPSVVG